MPLILVFNWERQVDLHELKASLAYKVSFQDSKRHRHRETLS